MLELLRRLLRGPARPAPKAYPCDEVGPYEDLEGPVTEVRGELCGEYPVTVLTDRGPVTGWTPRPPKAGYTATVRVYRAGGGWYPDNRIMSWSAHPTTSST